MALVATPIRGPEMTIPARMAPNRSNLPPELMVSEHAEPEPEILAPVQQPEITRTSVGLPVIPDIHVEEKPPGDTMVKFRWNKTYLTHSNEVFLEAEFLDGKPFPLRWNDRLELYESEPTRVPCDHHISMLRIDNDLLLLDSFEVNCYTFEVNLFLREEFPVTEEPECIEQIEENIQAKASTLSINSTHSNVTSSMEELDDSYGDEAPSSGSINLSRRYEDLVQKQMRLSGHETQESDGSDHHGVSDQVNGNYVEGSRLRELEDTLISLKHTLDDKEAEIRSLNSDLSDIRTENRMLNSQLQDQEERQGFEDRQGFNGDDSFNRLLAEKENLATEVYKLRNQLNQNGRSNWDRDSSSIDCYDPDNPEVLKQKLADLQSQVQDLHEASESASGELNRAEQRINALMQENENLQTLGGVSVEDIRAENQYLRQQVERLNERNSKLLNDSDSREREEMQAIRSDLRTLRERNQQVNEENIRLREELRDLRQRSDESLRRLRQSAPSPKFHDTSIGGTVVYKNGLDDTAGRYRSSLDDFVPGYTGYTSPVRSSSKISASPHYYVDDVSPSRKNRYSNHFDDDSSSTSSILNEVERELMLISGGTSGRHGRSRSFEPKKSRGSGVDHTDRALSPVGFRSCSPPPMVTQHNKAAFGYPEKKSILNTSGMRPFAPRSPGDISVGAVVKFQRQNGKISKGLVRYIGHLPGRNDTYLGLELENEAGKHDGMYNNQRYFSCKPNKGVFVTFSKIVMCWV